MMNTPRRPRILVITQVYAPEPNFITRDVAQALAIDGDVTVITSHPNYPYGRFYPNTRFWRPVKTREGNVVVWRLPMYPNHGLSTLKRLLSYLSFTLAAMTMAPFVAGRPDVVWVYQTPFIVACAALPFKLLCGQKASWLLAWPMTASRFEPCSR
jgi:colanic acid biosynthesis glycosyl transferase WcaI